MATALLTSGCSDWFDVSPKTDIKAEELFTTENGFRSALAGLYISMTDDDAYGDNLSFGMLDQMAQLYDMIPDGTTSRDAIYIYDVENKKWSKAGKLALVKYQYITLIDSDKDGDWDIVIATK